MIYKKVPARLASLILWPPRFAKDVMKNEPFGGCTAQQPLSWWLRRVKQEGGEVCFVEKEVEPT
jgi:hypothetical protein